MKQKQEYIQIDSFEELESSLRLSYLGKRFKDPLGNTYTVRVGKESNKLEIILLKPGVKGQGNEQSRRTIKEAENLHSQKIAKVIEEYRYEPGVKKIKESDFSELDLPDDVIEMGDFEIDESLLPDHIKKEMEEEKERKKPVLIEKKLVEEEYKKYVSFPKIKEEKNLYAMLIQDLDSINKKLLSTLDSLGKSQIFQITGDPSENKDVVGNLQREFHQDAFSLTERIRNRFKELAHNPRPIQHYLMHYDTKRHRLLETLDSDQMKFLYIIRWELFEPILKNVNVLHKMLYELLNLLNSKNKSDMTYLKQEQENYFKDSKISALYCLQIVSSLEKKLNSWKEKMD